MTKTPYARKALAVLLSLTMLLSCMVWTGVSAATVDSLEGRQLAVLDFTSNPKQSSNTDAYSATGGGNNSYAGGKATAVPTFDANGGYMTFKYFSNMTAGNGDKYAAFRYFPTQRISDTTNFTSNGNDDFRFKQGVTYEVSFKYKVVSAPVAAELRVLNYGLNWADAGSTAVRTGKIGTLNIAAGTTHTTWQNGKLTVTATNTNGVHFAVVPTDVASCTGLEVQMTDIVISKPANRPVGTEYKTDFTGYSVTANTDLSKTTSASAKVVAADAAHGSAMELSFLNSTGFKQAGFRFFANTGTTADKVAIAQGSTAMVKFSYKVQNLASAAELRVVAGSWAWNTGPNNNTGTFNTPSGHCVVAATLPATSTAGEWKTVAVLVQGACANAGIHIYLDSATPAAGDAVLVDDVQVIAGYTPVSITLDYNDGTTPKALLGIDGMPVELPVPTRPAQIFKGWNTKADGTGTMVSNLVYGDDIHEMTYYAIWEADPNAASILFETNGGAAISALYGNRGTAVSELPTPTKGLYTFVGWYTDAALTEKAEDVKFPATAGGSLTLYAKWSDPAPLAANPAPGGKLLLTQTFENATLSDFITNTNSTGKMDGVVTETSYQGSKSLKATIKDGWNSQRGRPRIVLQDDNGQKLKVEAGKTYLVSFWVKTTIRDGRFAFYAATMGASDVSTQISVQSGACHTLQKITATVGDRTATIARGNEVDETLLEADQWTQVVITIPSLTLDAAGEDNYLELGYTSNGSQAALVASWEPTPFYIDNVQVFESRPVTVSFDVNGGDPLDPVSSNTGTVELPVPYKFGYTYTGWYTDPSCDEQYKVTSPYSPLGDTQTLYTTWEKGLPTDETLVQDFEDSTNINEFKTNTTKPFAVVDEPDDNTAIKSTIKNGFNGNFSRPTWVFQMKGETSPLVVTPGMSATVTFRIKATRNTSKIGYMLDTMNDLSEITKNPSSSAAADAFRTMQVLTSTSHGSLNAAKNEVQNISLTAGEWVTITATIPEIVAHESGTQYLVLAITDTNSTPGNTSWVDYDLYVDDVTVTTQVGGFATNVTYNTMGGDPIEPGTGTVWTKIAVQATRAGYEFDGWYAEEACQTPVTTYPCAESVTLYAGWRAVGSETMTFEVDNNFVPEVYAHTDLSKVPVQTYYTSAGNGNNWYTGNSAKHSIEEVDGLQAMKVEYGAGANIGTQLFGFRLVKADGTAFTTTPGQTYQVSFKYKATALPTDAFATIIEASIPWATAGSNAGLGYTEFDGSLIKTTDVGAGWKNATVTFVSEHANGIHLALRSIDMTARQGTEIYFADIKVQSYQVTDFITTAGANRVEGEQNITSGGKAALKVDASTTGRVVYTSGLGGKLFPTNTLVDAIVWLYAPQDTTVTLTAYSDPSLDDMSTPHVMGEQVVSLTGGQWSRVTTSFGLSPVAGETASYISMGVRGTGTVYMDDIAIGTYANDNNKVQGYEEFEAKTYPNTSRLDGTIHGLNGNTVVAGTGYKSQQSLKITMNTDVEQDVARTVLIRDKMDATGTAGNGYIVTFYAMVREDMDVTFAIGTTDKIDVSERDVYANTAEAGATYTASLKAGEWTAIAIAVADLQGKNPELTVNPYVTLAAWFDGAADDNQKAVYIDDVLMKDYRTPSVTREDTLCFENTDVFGFGKQLNLSTAGTMTVSMDQNHTAAGYYSLKVTNNTISGGARPQFNLMNANGEAIKVKEGETYRVSFWVYVDADQPTTKIRYWLSVADDDAPYTDTDQKNADVVHEPTEGETVTKGAWKQVSVTLADIEKSGYLRLGICGFNPVAQSFYLDDIRVTEYQVFDLTGDETVWNFETYNPGDKDFIRKGNGGVTDEINHTDKGLNALKLVGKTWSGADRNQFILINPATKQPYEFVKGDSYTFSFWLYYSSTTGLADFVLNTWILGVDDPTKPLDNKSEWNGKMEWDRDMAPISNDGNLIPDAWNQFEITVTVTNGKYLLIGMTNDLVQGGGYEYFIDDIEIRKPTPAIVTLDANGGAFDEADKEFLNDKGQYIVRTAVGLFVTGPSIDPYLSGKRFMGWALDPEGQEFFDILVTPIDKTELTLYALWGDWDTDEGYDKIDKDNLSGEKDEIKYKTEIHSEKVWTGNATIPVLDFDDNFALDDADPVTYTPPAKDDVGNDADTGLPVWLIIVIIVAAVVVVGGGAVLALLLLKNKKSNDEKEGNA